MGKGLALFVIGKKDLQQGMNILGAHIDSPRLDLKQVPLYEDTQMALLDTHYYGGVKNVPVGERFRWHFTVSSVKRMEVLSPSILATSRGIRFLASVIC